MLVLVSAGSSGVPGLLLPSPVPLNPLPPAPPATILACVPLRGGNGGPDCFDVVEERDAFVPVRLGRGGGISVRSRGGDDLVVFVLVAVGVSVESIVEFASDLTELTDRRFGFGGGTG